MSEYGSFTPKRHGHFYGPEEPDSMVNHLTRLLPEADAGWLIGFGAVYLNHKRQIDEATVVSSQDIIRVHFQPKRYPVDRDLLKSRVVFENDDFIVVDKPSGLPMHPTLDNLRENLVSAFDFPLYVTHRLDVPTSGHVLVAKTKEFQKYFNQLLTDRKVRKIYSALVEKEIAPQTVTHFMLDDVKAPKQVFETPPAQKNFECRMIIHSVAAKGAHFELEIELLTGRTHQIRAQLAALGAPILGDEMYGGRPSDTFGLSSKSLEFVSKGTPYFFHSL